MARMPSRVGAALAALVIVGTGFGPAVGVVRAADVATSISLVSATDPAYLGTNVWYVAQVNPAGAIGIVYFESSTNGVDWATTAYHEVLPDGSATGGERVDGSEPLGLRTIRARFEGNPGWAPSTSTNTLSQTVARRASSFTLFSASPSSVDAHLIVPGTPVRLWAQTIGTNEAIVFEEWTPTGWNLLADQMSIQTGGSYYADVGPLGEGGHTLRARFDGNTYFTPSEATITVDIPKGTTGIGYYIPPEVQANHTFEASVVVQSGIAAVPVTGDLTITDTTTGVVLATSSDGGFGGQIGPVALGPHVLVIDYAGDPNWMPATSGPINVNVLPDAVEATGVGVSRTLFYPVKDGYRDSVSAKGNRLEPASVSIRVLNSVGRVVRSAAIPTATGAYGWSWNGKNSAARLQPAGKYRIVQTLRDAGGTLKTVTSRITLSLKRLHYFTKTYTKVGAAFSAKGQAGVGSVRTTGSRFYRGVVLRSGYADTNGGTGWSAVGYAWTLPSAVVYKSITVRAYGLSIKQTAIAKLGVWNWTTCPQTTGTWYVDCFERWREIVYTTAWYSRAVSITTNRRGKTVRSSVWLEAGQLGKADIGKVGLTVKYGVLR
jgi:hypothetical protein